MSKICEAPACKKPAVLKGLCRRHYMRLRRHGDFERRKTGPKGDPIKHTVLKQFEEWSPRTQQRYWTAFKRLQTLGQWQGTGAAPLQKVIKACTRPNGSMNITKFLQMSEDMAAMYIAKMGEEK